MYVTPTEEELVKRYNPELRKRSIETRHEREKEFDDFVTNLKRYAKSDKPSPFNCNPIIASLTDILFRIQYGLSPLRRRRGKRKLKRQTLFAKQMIPKLDKKKCARRPVLT
jgi:hypothetical protein